MLQQHERGAGASALVATGPLWNLLERAVGREGRKGRRRAELACIEPQGSLPASVAEKRARSGIRTRADEVVVRQAAAHVLVELMA